MSSNDRSNGRATPPDQPDPPPLDWIVLVFAGVFVALMVFGVLYVRV